MTVRIDEVLAYEIKRDIADRYFGFRKLIEDDKLDLETKTRQYSFILGKRISFDLIRLYILLKDEDLIFSFLDLTPFDKNFFYDPYLTESKTIRQRVFEGINARGLFRSSRFENLFFDCYERLEDHTERYRNNFEELKEINETIVEEIKLFYQKNDLGSILGFLRSLASKKNSGLQGGTEIGMAQSLEKKLSLEAPLPVEHFLPVIEPMPPLDTISKKLKKIIKQAYTLHDEESLDFFTSKRPQSTRP